MGPCGANNVLAWNKYYSTYTCGSLLDSMWGKRASISHDKTLMGPYFCYLDVFIVPPGVFLLLTTLACWIPYSVTQFDFLDVEHSHFVHSLSMWIAYMNNLLDPLVYAFFNTNGRTALRRYWRSVAGVWNRCVKGLSH